MSEVKIDIACVVGDRLVDTRAGLALSKDADPE